MGRLDCSSGGIHWSVQPRRRQGGKSWGGSQSSSNMILLASDDSRRSSRTASPQLSPRWLAHMRGTKAAEASPVVVARGRQTEMSLPPARFTSPPAFRKASQWLTLPVRATSQPPSRWIHVECETVSQHVQPSTPVPQASSSSSSEWPTEPVAALATIYPDEEDFCDSERSVATIKEHLAMRQESTSKREQLLWDKVAKAQQALKQQRVPRLIPVSCVTVETASGPASGRTTPTTVAAMPTTSALAPIQLRPVQESAAPRSRSSSAGRPVLVEQVGVYPVSLPPFTTSPVRH